MTRRNGHRRQQGRSPADMVKRELRDLQAMKEEIDEVAQYLVQVFAEAYLYGLQPASSGPILTGGAGWSRGEVRDEAAETVVSWDKRHVRLAVRSVSEAIPRAKADLADARALLEDAKRSHPAGPHGTGWRPRRG